MRVAVTGVLSMVGAAMVLGAFTMSNIRLLLLSHIGQPYDPASNRGGVGRNFTYQVGGAGAVGWYDDRILNRFMGSGANGYSIDEFNSDNSITPVLISLEAAISPATTPVLARSRVTDPYLPEQQPGGVPNLFVVGASNFPQNAGYNPTGTAGALAYHAVDAIVTRYLPGPCMLA